MRFSENCIYSLFRYPPYLLIHTFRTWSICNQFCIPLTINIGKHQGRNNVLIAYTIKNMQQLVGQPKSSFKNKICVLSPKLQLSTTYIVFLISLILWLDDKPLKSSIIFNLDTWCSCQSFVLFYFFYIIFFTNYVITILNTTTLSHDEENRTSH